MRRQHCSSPRNGFSGEERGEITAGTRAQGKISRAIPQLLTERILTTLFRAERQCPSPGNSLAQAVSVLLLDDSLVTQCKVHSHGGLSHISPAPNPALSTGSALSSASRKGDSNLCFSPSSGYSPACHNWSAELGFPTTTLQ